MSGVSRLRIGVVLLTALLVGGTAAGQDSLEWLTGTWSAQRRSRDGATDHPPTTLQIASADAILRIVENGDDGTVLQCRVDGRETRFRQVTSKATVDYALKCRLGKQSVEIRGRFIVSGMPDVPPQRYEIENKYELSTSGALRVRSRLWGFTKELGEIELLDDRIEFGRVQ